MREVDEQRPSAGGRSAGGRLLLASATIMLALAGAFFMVPLLFLAPVPLAALVYRNGYRTGTVTAVLTLVLVAFMQQRMLATMPATIPDAALQSYSFTTMIALVTIGLIGMVIGGAWREGASWSQAFWLGAGATVLPGLLAWTAIMVLHQVDFVAVMFDNWLEVVRNVIDEAGRSGLNEETVRALEQAAAETELNFALARPFLPGLVAVGAIFSSFVSTSLAGVILRRLGDEPPAFPAFVRWRWPWTLALGFIAAHALLLFAGGDRLSASAVVGQNLLIVLNLLFAAQGAAVGWHLLSQRRVATPLRVVLLVVVYWWLPVVLVWTGVLDTWLNFRRLSPDDEGEGDRTLS